MSPYKSRRMKAIGRVEGAIAASSVHGPTRQWSVFDRCFVQREL